MQNQFEFHETYKDPVTKRTSKHVYLMDGKRMTGVTTVLGILAKPALIQWAADMAVKYIRENCRNRVINVDREHMVDKETYLVHEKDLDEARVAHAKKKDDAAEKGTDTHKLVENYIKACIFQNNGHPLALPVRWEAKGGLAIGVFSGKSELPPTMLVVFVKWATDNKVRFLESEKKVYSKDWFVAGTADFTCEIAGKRYVGDLKTYKKLWDRIPHFQTAAYMKMLVEMGEPKYDGTVIVNINKDTNELTESYSYAHDEDIKSFEAALQLYRTLN